MEQQTHENLNVTLPVVSIEPIQNQDTAGSIGAELEVSDVELDPSCIYIWAEGIKSAGGDQSESCACFDITFNISVSDSTRGSLGSHSTFSIVKRVKVDKVKLASQAAAQGPAAVIENKEQRAHLKRLRTLAGLE